VDDQLRRDDVSWEKFQDSPTFAQIPCTREEFLSLYTEYRLFHLTSMDFGDFYRWHHASRDLLDGEGNLTPASIEAADAALAETEGQPLHHRKHALCLALKVHPRHREPFLVHADLRVGDGNGLAR